MHCLKWGAVGFCDIDLEGTVTQGDTFEYKSAK